MKILDIDVDEKDIDEFEAVLGGDLVYPQCKEKEGMAKVRCLVNAIKRDGISNALKVKRIVYLIAINKKAQWIPAATMEGIVKRAIAPLRKGKDAEASWCERFESLPTDELVELHMEIDAAIMEFPEVFDKAKFPDEICDIDHQAVLKTLEKRIQI